MHYFPTEEKRLQSSVSWLANVSFNIQAWLQKKKKIEKKTRSGRLFLLAIISNAVFDRETFQGASASGRSVFRWAAHQVALLAML